MSGAPSRGAGAGAGVGAVRCAVALGSNLGDRARHLERALAALREHPRIALVAVSPAVETDPVGGPPDQGPFLNGALLLDTDFAPEELLAVLQGIELGAGRDRAREPRHGPRVLDLDLLLYGEREVRGERLTVPHPGLEERLFVLEPLAAIAPELVLPRSGLTVRERVAELRQLEALDAGGNAP